MPYVSAGSGGGRSFQPPVSMFGPKPPVQSDPLTTQYNLYNTAVGQNAEDYSSIMKGYKDLLARSQSPTSDYTQSMGNLRELSKSGGYTPEGIAEIRARGVSPIRSIYAGANRDIDRQRSLQGGYSPNYGALKAKMARELSSSIGNQMTNINADIAQRVAGNRLGIAGTYSSAARDPNQPGMEALRGMTSLYGTIPAMASTFGNQALQGAQLQNQITNQGNQQGLEAISQGMSLRRPTGRY